MNNDYQSPQNEQETPPFAESAAVPPEAPKAALPPQPPAPRPIRRIGTLTMGGALIVTGATALVSTFYPGFDLTNVFKLSPVIFIFLGLEILCAYFFSKGARLQYDFLSGFVCFVLICGGLALSAMPIVWNYVGPPAMELRNRVSNEIEDALYAALKDVPEISSLNVNVNSDYACSVTDVSFETLTQTVDTYVTISLTGKYADKAAFATTCEWILARMRSLPYSFENVSIRNETEQGRYGLDVNNRFQLNMDAARLAEQVDYNSYGNVDEESTPEPESSETAATEPAASSEADATSSVVESFTP